MSIEWNMRPVRRLTTLRDMIGAALDAAPPEVHATATSRYTVETVDARLSVLHGRTDPEAVRERDYLLDLRQRKFGSAG